jgi:hypothetical protein
MVIILIISQVQALLMFTLKALNLVSYCVDSYVIVVYGS